MGFSPPDNLYRSALGQIESAVLGLLAAVRGAKGSACPDCQSPAPAPAGPVVADALNEFLLSKARANRSDAYLQKLRAHLAAFARRREGRPLASVQSREIEDFVYGNDWSSATRLSFLRDLQTWSNWAVARGYLAASPAAAVDKPLLSNEPPGIHTPEQVRQVLETARRLDADVCRHLALRYFAGLRRSEAAALGEECLRPEYVEVPAARAKTRRRRLIPIRPALRAWLAVGGALPLTDASDRLTAVVAASGVPWPRNAPRHSFCSYHLAAFHRAGQTALEAGHTEQILCAHYRELVTREDAAALGSAARVTSPTRARRGRGLPGVATGRRACGT